MLKASKNVLNSLNDIIYQDQILISNLSENLKMNFDENTINHQGCCIHIIQLIIRDIFKEFDVFDDLILKIQNIAKEMKKSKYKDFYFWIELPHDIRWNNIYLMLSNFNKNKIKFLNCCVEFKESLENLILSDYELNKILFLENFLYQFYKITKILEQEVYYPFEFLYWILNTKKILKKNFKNKLFDELEINLFKKTLERIEIRLQNVEIKLSSYKILAFYLWPNLNKTLNEDEKKIAKNNIYKDFFENKEIKKDKHNKSNNKNSNIWDESESLIIDNKDFREFVEKIENWNLCSYDFWKIFKHKYIEIYECLLYFDCYILSNGSIERSFSKVKTLSNWKRNKTSDQSLKKRLMVKESDLLIDILNKYNFN